MYVTSTTRKSVLELRLCSHFFWKWNSTVHFSPARARRGEPVSKQPAQRRGNVGAGTVILPLPRSIPDGKKRTGPQTYSSWFGWLIADVSICIFVHYDATIWVFPATDVSITPGRCHADVPRRQWLRLSARWRVEHSCHDTVYSFGLLVYCDSMSKWSSTLSKLWYYSIVGLHVYVVLLMYSVIQEETFKACFTGENNEKTCFFSWF